jgi:hypothetical protein
MNTFSTSSWVTGVPSPLHFRGEVGWTHGNTVSECGAGMSRQFEIKNVDLFFFAKNCRCGFPNNRRQKNQQSHGAIKYCQLENHCRNVAEL